MTPTVGRAPVGVAVLGCAHSAHVWAYAQALTKSDNARLVGVHDADPRLAEPLVRDFGVTFVADAGELVAGPGVEAVIVCSATAEHRMHVDLAASYGRSVLCEKPIATTLTDANAMVTACADAGVLLQMAFVTRFHPLVARVRAAVQAGEIGEVLAMVTGNRGRPPLPPSYPPWITDPKLAGGGALIDHSVHLTDALRHVTGQDVARVTAEAGELLWSAGVDDVALLGLTLTGGAVASLDPSWSVPAGNPWDYDFFLRILGTEGSVAIDDLASSLRVVSPRYGAGLRLVPFGADPDVELVEAFLTAVRTGETQGPSADGSDGRAALEVALAGYTSAAEHRAVELPG